jgi:predicted acylesterase/phospholipase RssA
MNAATMPRSLRILVCFAVSLRGVFLPIALSGQADVPITIPLSITAVQKNTLDTLHAAITVEGGGTLGAYEGGITWALVELFRLKRDPSRTSALTAEQTSMLSRLPVIQFHAAAGASAGSINAFLAANRWCSTEAPGFAESSTFWKVWIPTGLTQLLPGRDRLGQASEKGILSRLMIDTLFTQLDGIWKQSSYDDTCELMFGATITRLAKDSVDVSDHVHPRNQRYAARFIVRGPHKGNFAPLYLPAPQQQVGFRLGALIELPRNGDTIGHRFANDLIKASSGYPLAFEPYEIQYCPVPRDSTNSVAVNCQLDATRKSYFVDGGVFDNGPLTLGYGLALTDRAHIPLGALRMLFITPDQRRTTGGKRDRYGSVLADSVEVTSELKTEGLDAVTKLLQAFVPSARQYELQITARLLPTVQQSDLDKEAFRIQLERARRGIQDEREKGQAAYAEWMSDWRKSHPNIESLKFVRDSLIHEMVKCRLTPSACPVLPGDSTLVAILPQPYPVDSSERPQAPVVSITEVELGRPELQPFNRHLLVTRRWHPLGGDWLAGFGGFLGRPLREYDFYVGVYDAFALITEKLLCEDPADAICFRRELKSLIAGAPLPLTHTDKTVLAALYRTEFAESPAPSGVADTIHTSREQILVAIVNAMAARMDTAPLSWRACKEGGSIERFECSDGIEFVFRLLRETPNFTESLSVPPDECRKNKLEKDECLTDPQFARFVEQPFPELNWLAGEILARISATTPKESSLKTPLTVATAAYFATNERARRGWDGGSVSLPSSLPPLLGFGLALVPSSIGGFAGVQGWYIEWVRRLHIGRNFAVGPTARVVWASGFIRDNPVARGNHFVPGLRAEWLVSGPFAPWLSTVGVESSYWTDWYLSQLYPNGFEKSGVSAGVTTALFAQRVRISVGTKPTKYHVRDHDKRRVYVSFGLGDTNGAAYWIYKALRK